MTSTCVVTDTIGKFIVRYFILLYNNCIQYLLKYYCTNYNPFSLLGSHHIFNQSTLAAAKQLWSTRSIYNADVLREFLSEQSSIQLPMWMIPCSASQPRLGVVATHVGDTPQPYLFRNFRIPSVSKYEGVCDVTWLDAILASTAAPGEFALH